MDRHTDPAGSRESGFTVVELLISLVVVAEVLLAVLLLFDFSNRLTRAQINVSDMQQALRVSHHELAREIRMAGAGGLPATNPAPGGAVWMINNVAAPYRIGGAGTPLVVEGTDVIKVRGVFSTPLFHVDSKQPGTFVLNGTLSPMAATAGTILIRSKTPTLIPQPLAALIEAVEQDRPEALLVVSPRTAQIYSVVELDPESSNVTDPDALVIAFKITNGTYTPEYSQFSPGGVYNPNLDLAAFVGILEEHRFYVREEHAIPADATSELTPKLARARTYPGVDVPYKDDPANWDLDIADNILDMQIALGRDTTNGGGSILQDANDIGDDDRIFESADGRDDDWLYNSSNDDAANPVWLNARLHYLRISLLGRTDRRDPGYRAPLLTRIEDKTFAANHPLNLEGNMTGALRQQRMFRRRVLRTTIDLRNM